jgi:3-deoxy-D-manno-octulosonic-acid transferase
VLLLAPRHLSRLSAVEKEVREAGFFPVRKSDLSGGGENLRVILLDTLGELGRLYAGADLIFIGGSLVPVGGHNLVEAAAHGKVVFFGPHMENFAEASLQAVASGCGVQAKDPEDLAALLGEWIRSPERIAEAEARAREWVASRMGSVGKNLEWIRGFIGAESATRQRVQCKE